MRYPIIATRGLVAFPKIDTYIEIGRPQSLMALVISEERYENKLIIVSQKKPMKQIVENSNDLFSVGTLVTFRTERDLPNGIKNIIVKGIERVEIKDLKINPNGIIDGEAISLKTIPLTKSEEEVVVSKVIGSINAAVEKIINVPESTFANLSEQMNSEELTDMLATYLPIPFEQKQIILESKSLKTRLDIIAKFASIDQGKNDVDKTIDNKVRSTLDKQQKEFLLREKMKAIKEELGDISSKDSEVDAWKEKIKDNKYPKYVKDKIEEEIKKFDAMPSISAEAHVSRGYIEWLIKLPWNTYTKDNNDISKAKEILDKGHYALKEPKERIIEHLAVKIATKKKSAPIITFVGPPGVGKTSLAKSIGEAVGREVVKVSLGGVKDESEIRGHRRTYVGAMPGKIIQALNRAKTSNPIILLDEIDKMSSDYKGDPTSAMLEVLDPEQNQKFQDHYIELEYDLSQVMFIATANYIEQIPSPLLDRVELIQLDQYTSEEKLSIAKKYIIPASIKEHGLKKSEFKISDKTIAYVISRYTREAGVRQLQRTIDSLSRKIVLRKLSGEIKGAYTITQEKVNKLLGKEKVTPNPLKGKKEIGYATGMFYSAVGGGVLPIEVNTYPSDKGGVQLTGSIKEVMKESMEVAIGYIKSNSKKFNIHFDFENTRIQVHVPEGAIPKDGPSAGIAFTTAILSAILNKGVPKDIAMTGEITLRGNVLQIGGLKQKTLGAVEAGVKTIFIPKTNEKDIPELAEKVKKTATIIPVDNYSEIFDFIFK